MGEREREGGRERESTLAYIPGPLSIWEREKERGGGEGEREHISLHTWSTLNMGEREREGGGGRKEESTLAYIPGPLSIQSQLHQWQV